MAESIARYRLPRFLAGLDVGQMADPTALAVLEWRLLYQHGAMVPQYDVRHLERVPLQTSYPAMARGVRERLEHLRAKCLLVIDATGVGLGTVQDFRDEWADYDPIEQRRKPAPNKPPIIALTLVNAERPRFENWDEVYVPKRDVVMDLVLALQQHRFRVAASLPDATTLFKEGQNFQWKVSPSGTDQYGAWREGQHDDLLLAVAIAVWYGERYAPRTVPGNGQQQYATPTGNPLARHAAWRRKR